MSTPALPPIRLTPHVDLVQHVWDQPFTVTLQFSNKRLYDLFVRAVTNPEGTILQVNVHLLGGMMVVAGLMAISHTAGERSRGPSRTSKGWGLIGMGLVVVGIFASKPWKLFLR